jgi:hypothetical protein
LCVSLKPAGGEVAAYDVVGTASILEEGEKNRGEPIAAPAILKKFFKI